MTLVSPTAKASAPVRLAVRGMSCGSCEVAVRAALEAVPGVRSAEVSAAAGAAVVIAPGVAPDALLGALAAAGREASLVADSTPRADAPVASAARRYRCGCARAHCTCSAVPVIAGDAGVLVRLSEPLLDCAACCDEESEMQDLERSRVVALKQRNAIVGDSAGTVMMPNVAAIATTPSAVQSAPRIDARLNVFGMTCMSCTGRVSAALAGMDGLREPAKVDLLGSAVLISLVYTEEPLAVVVEAKKRIENAGYRAEIPGPTAALLNVGNARRANMLFLQFSDAQTARRAAVVLRASEFVEEVVVCGDNERQASRLHAGSLSSEDDSPELRNGVVLEPSGCWSSNTSPSPNAGSDVESGARPGALAHAWKWVMVHRRVHGDKNTLQRALQVSPKAHATGANVHIAALLENNDIQFSVLANGHASTSGGQDPSVGLRAAALEYRRMFLIALVFTAPVVLLSMILVNVPALKPSLSSRIGRSAISVTDLVSWLLATPVQFYCGYRFYRGSWFAMKSRRANMDMLIALGTSVAYVFSVIILIASTVNIQRGSNFTKEPVAFETSSLLITIVLLGKWLETLAKSRAATSVSELAGLRPSRADVVSGPPSFDFIANVDVNLVVPGDYVRVNSGAAIPVDSIVEVGETTVDESMLTGESWPVSKRTGDPVYAGTVNGRGSVLARCTAIGQEATLSKIIQLVQNAQAAKAPIEQYADRISAKFVPFVMTIALVTTVIWFGLAQGKVIPTTWRRDEGTFMFALLFGMSVLVISCPCALGIATSTVVMVTTGLGAKKLGILYKGGGEALQASRNVKTVLFDKTGTLTVGSPTVTSCERLWTTGGVRSLSCRSVSVSSLSSAGSAVAEPGDDEIIATTSVLEDVLGNSSNDDLDVFSVIAAAEQHSDHPLAVAISKYISDRLFCAVEAGHRAPVVTPIRFHDTIAGKGVECTLEDGRCIRVGRASWILLHHDGVSLLDDSATIALTSSTQKAISEMERSGKTVVFASVDREPVMAFGIEDPVRTEAKAVISYLKTNGVQCGMVTGDGELAAFAVADAVGIERAHVVFRALPFQKVDAVKAAVSACGSGRNQSSVAFVGDGINDAGALAAADVGIALGCGSQIAAESASIVLTRSHLQDLVVALDLARVSFRRITLNYVWAFGYNAIGIPVAAGALFPFTRLRLPPFIAAVAMGASSISVVLSSLALRRYRPPRAFGDNC
jgi:P-type Cu+ transporter